MNNTTEINEQHTMEKHYEIFWHRGRGAKYQSELVQTTQSPKEAVEFLKKAVADWGTAGHPDYMGGYWSVDVVHKCYETESCETIHETEVCR